MRKGKFYKNGKRMHIRTTNGNLEIISVKLEQMLKKFKMHRCTMDFDSGLQEK
jgi:hypothetical protein